MFKVEPMKYDELLTLMAVHVNILPPQEQIAMTHEYARILYNTFGKPLEKDFRDELMHDITSDIMDVCSNQRKKQREILRKL